MEFLQEFLDNAKFFGQNESIRRLKTWIKRHFDDYFELIDFFELYHPDDCSSNDELIYFGVQFKNPYLAARVVGRNGTVIRRIREMTGTEIISPQYHLNERMTNNFRRPSQCSRQSFLIISRNAIRIFYSIILIITTGIYFLQRFRDLISPNPDEICYRLPVRSDLVPSILANNAMKIILIQWSTDVRIVSPKPYCNPCQFFIIGRQENVRIAINLVVEHIKSIIVSPTIINRC
ncbi:hypothetical protein DERP_003584 [Dermatophagoides pteronyssinus]|uniref:K Homology domain-containing protein n=1 Tax=Dermatophagoides pteronyssinus TaxID=6956 RepID=A0ABQ8JL18_DERPT|nr:hypothetical protein DERP_003584 [Dermatophagoides pteronyssinus]